MGDATKEVEAPVASAPVVADADVTKPLADAPQADNGDGLGAAAAAADKKDDAGDAAAATDAATPSKAAGKSAASLVRRKSVGGPKLNRKGSKARIVHLDAKPGDHYFVKLKGYPAWPVIVCDEDMLPQQLLKSRPVTAVRPDGTYREDFADGGKRVADRTFPVMYLFTNEL